MDLAQPLEATVEAFAPADRPLVDQVVRVVEDTLGDVDDRLHLRQPHHAH